MAPRWSLHPGPEQSIGISLEIPDVDWLAKGLFHPCCSVAVCLQVQSSEFEVDRTSK